MPRYQRSTEVANVNANPAGRSRRALRGMALSALIFAFIIGWVALGPGARNALATSIVDFSQCSNGTGTATDCPGGWINGILNPNNSHYAEDNVVPQRWVLDIDTAGSHTITFF